MREMNRVVRHADKWALYVDDTRRYVADVETTIEQMSDWSIDCAMCYDKYAVISGRTLYGRVAIVYEFLDDRREIDSKMRLAYIGKELHKDSGHAVEDCLGWIKREG